MSRGRSEQVTWERGKRRGSFTAEIDPEGTVLKGQYVQDRMDMGYVEIIWSNGTHYKGEFNGMTITGSGTCTYANGEKYTGLWMNGSQHGQGAYTFVGGAVYEGGYTHNRRSGKGMLLYGGEVIKAGMWKNGVLVTPSVAV